MERTKHWVVAGLATVRRTDIFAILQWADWHGQTTQIRPSITQWTLLDALRPLMHFNHRRLLIAQIQITAFFYFIHFGAL